MAVGFNSVFKGLISMEGALGTHSILSRIALGAGLHALGKIKISDSCQKSNHFSYLSTL